MRQVLMVCLLVALVAPSVSVGQTVSASDYPQSLERELQALLAGHARESSDPRALVKLSGLYLDIGDDLYSDQDKRRAVYEEGARVAKRALALDESSAEAHFLYAANLGNAAQLQGVMASAFTIWALKAHVTRALELQNDHAPALHMMGMMLEELPWILGGDPAGALAYLKRAVWADPQYEHARLDLAKAYLKRHDREAARRELTIILGTVHSGESNRYHPQAKQLLELLESQDSRAARP